MSASPKLLDDTLPTVGRQQTQAHAAAATAMTLRCASLRRSSVRFGSVPSGRRGAAAQCTAAHSSFVCSLVPYVRAVCFDVQGTVELEWSTRQRSVYWLGGADAEGKVSGMCCDELSCAALRQGRGVEVERSGSRRTQLRTALHRDAFAWPTLTAPAASASACLFVYAAVQLMMIDQRDLPARFDIVAHSTLGEVVHSIKIMLVRGAPAIGAAGGQTRTDARPLRSGTQST